MLPLKQLVECGLLFIGRTVWIATLFLAENQHKRNYSFKTKLDKDDCDRLDEIEIQYSEIMQLEEDKAFKHGFCLAALLMIEIFSAEYVIDKAKKQDK